MKKRLLAILLPIITLCSIIFGMNVILASATITVEFNPTVVAGRDDGESEYRILINGGSWNIVSNDENKSRIIINGKSLKELMASGKITEVFCKDSNPSLDNIRIDLPRYGEGILKLDGTDTVILKAGLVNTDKSGIITDQTTVIDKLKTPTVAYGFADGIVVENDAFSTKLTALTFKPVFAPGNGAGVQKIAVKLNGTDLIADNGSYTANLAKGQNKIEFFCEENGEPYAFVRKTVTVTLEEDVVEGPIYVLSGQYTRNAGGRPSYYDNLTLKFSNVINEADRTKLVYTINGKTIEQMKAIAGFSVPTVKDAVWQDNRTLVLSFLFFSEPDKKVTNIFKYDGTDEIKISGVTEVENILKRTSDGKIYNETKGETAPAITEGVQIDRISIERDHETKKKDAIHIFFKGNVDILGAENIKEGVLLFNTGVVKVNGNTLQQLWDANNKTEVYWVNASPNSFLRIDVYYEGVAKEVYDRDGMNKINIDPSFITMTNKELSVGFGEYTYDGETVFKPGETIPENTPITMTSLELKLNAEKDNHWILVNFDIDLVTVQTTNIHLNNRIRNNLVIGGKTLAEINANRVVVEAHAGTEGNKVIRLSIKKTAFDSIFKKDGTDTFILKMGFGLNKYDSTSAEKAIDIADATNPVINMESVTGTVNKAPYELKFTVEDASVVDVVVKNGETVIEKVDGKYSFNLNSGANIITVSAKDQSFFKNSATSQITVTYEEIPVITANGLVNDSTVKIASNKLAVLTSVGTITSVKLGETALTKGTDEKYAVTLKEGLNTITIEATNGTTITTLVINVTLDSKAPIIETSVVDKTTVESENFEFTASSTENGTMVVKLNGAVVSVKDAKYSVKLSEGENKIVITSTDSAGNSDSKTFTVTYTKKQEPTKEKGCGMIAFNNNNMMTGLMVLVAFGATIYFALRKRENV